MRKYHKVIDGYCAFVILNYASNVQTEITVSDLVPNLQV